MNDDDYKVLLDAVSVIIDDIWLHFRFVTCASLCNLSITYSI